jgi:signal transduction histidine kinase
MMPELDGYEVCQRLKNEEKTRHIPVIFISALNEVFNKVKAFSVGGVDYITKPFQVEEILARVATHLRLSSLQQNLVQKTQALTETLQALQVTQNQLIQTEKMAALGQLIAGIAHEINTPMGAIRSSIENITDFFDQYLLELPAVFSHLSAEEHQFLRTILSLTQGNNQNLSTREKRQIKKTIIQYLDTETIANSDVIADSLVDLGILEISQVSLILPYFKTHHGLETLHFADKIYSLTRSSRTIVSATEKASKIVFALKNYSRCEAQENLVYANITDGLETVLTLYYNQIKRGVEVIKNYQKISPILCYPDELNQVWTNLISNALYAMNNHGVLQIQVQQIGQTLQVSISDTGSGIPPEIQDKIFEPFFTTKPRGEGTGLGLDIVRKIIDKHQGKIELTSVPSETKFTVFLPIEAKLFP